MDAQTDLLQGRKSELITALLKFSITETPQGRTSLLNGISGSDTLSRDMNIARHDLDLIISQLVKRGRMTNGHWPLVILLDNAMPFVKGYEGENTLTDIRRLLTEGSPVGNVKLEQDDFVGRDKVTEVKSTIEMEYELKVLLKLVREALGDDELSDLCLTEFNPVWDKFASGINKAQRERILIDYVKRQQEIPKLLESIREINFKVYATYESELLKKDEVQLMSSTTAQPDPFRIEKEYLGKLIEQLAQKVVVEQYVELVTQIDQSSTLNLSQHSHKGISDDLHESKALEKFLRRSSGKRQSPHTPIPLRLDTDTETSDLFISIEQAFSRFNKFVLIGPPGAGKSTILHRLAFDAALRRRNSDATEPLPILVELSNWKHHESPLEFISDEIGKFTEHVGKFDDLEGMLRRGEVVVYLEDLDKLGGDVLDEDGSSNKIKKLNIWLNEVKRAIITCRAYNYVGHLRLGRLPIVQIKELDEEKIREFVDKYLSEHSTAFLEQILPEDLVKRQHKENFLELIKNPFLLSRLITIYIHIGGELPRNSGELIQVLVEDLWDREYDRQLNQSPSKAVEWIKLEEMKTAFSRLAFEMIQEGKLNDVSYQWALGQLAGASWTAELDQTAKMHAEKLLKAAVSASIIEISKNPDDISKHEIRFNHLLLDFCSLKKEYLKREKR